MRTQDEFVYENGKLQHVKKNGKGGVTVCNFYLKIDQEKIYRHAVCTEQGSVEGYEEHTKWAVKIYCMGQVFQAEKTVQELLSENEILKITRDRAYFELGPKAKDSYRKYLNSLIAAGNFRQVIFYENSGWVLIKGIGKVYLTDGGIVGKEHIPIKADVPYHFDYAPELLGSREVFRNTLGMRLLCKEKPWNSSFLLHFCNAALLQTLLREFGGGINFITALIGTTNSYKTSLGTLFSRLFDRTTMSVPDIRFDSTIVAMTEKMGVYGDAVLMVDDFVPYSSKRKAAEQMEKLETLIRGYGDRVPRKRSKLYAKINGVPEYSPVKGCCMITGELFQTESESSDTRVVQLDFDKGDVDLELLNYYQQIPLNYPTFAYDYICYLQDNLNFIETLIGKISKEIRMEKIDNIQIPRFVDSFAAIVTEIRIFYEYAVERRFMSKEEAEKFIEEDVEYAKKIIVMNEAALKVKSPVTTICRALQDGINGGELKRYICGQMEAIKEFGGVVMEDTEFFYILPETLWRTCKEYYKKIGEDFFYKSGRELSAPLRKAGLILVKLEGKNQKLRATHKIGSFTSKRFFCIKKGEMEKRIFDFEKF